jgi:hypothetical protein
LNITSITWGGALANSGFNGHLSCSTNYTTPGPYTGTVEIRGVNGAGTIYCANGSVTFKVISVTVQHPDVWILDGAEPTGYYLDTEVTGNDGGAGTGFTWSFTYFASGQVEYNSGYSSGSSPTTKVHGSNSSTDISDVSVNVSYSGVTLTDCASITVRRPVVMVRDGTRSCWDHPLSGPGRPGYECRINYKIKDQLNEVLPETIGWGESFTSDVTSDRSDNKKWTRGPFWYGSTDPAIATDKIGVLFYDGMDPVCYFNSEIPNTGWDDKVDHWTGKWYVGEISNPYYVELYWGLMWQRHKALTDHSPPA